VLHDLMQRHGIERLMLAADVAAETWRRKREDPRNPGRYLNALCTSLVVPEWYVSFAERRGRATALSKSHEAISSEREAIKVSLEQSGMVLALVKADKVAKKFRHVAHDTPLRRPCNGLWVSRRIGAEKSSIRCFTYPAKIKAIGVETGLDCCVHVNPGLGVEAAGGEEKIQLLITEVVVCPSKRFGEQGASRTMLRVVVFVQPATVVEDGKELNHFLVGAGRLSQMNSVCADPGQMAETMDAVPVDDALIPYGPDKFFGNNSRHGHSLPVVMVVLSARP
jgi:hypothetical protein